jgi:DnaJ-class molecular chaperone
MSTWSLSTQWHRSSLISSTNVPLLLTAGNHYEILEATYTSTASEVYTAYKKVAKVALRQSDRGTYLSIKRAYAVLSDPDDRPKYDKQLGFQSAVQCKNPQSAPPEHTDYCPAGYYHSVTVRSKTGLNSSSSSSIDNNSSSTSCSSSHSSNGDTKCGSSSDRMTADSSSGTSSSSGSNSNSDKPSAANASESNQNSSSSSSSSSSHSSWFRSGLAYIFSEIISALKGLAILVFSTFVFLAIGCAIEEGRAYFHPV